MKKLHFLRTATLMAALTLSLSFLWAQTQYGEIRGKIFDKASGAPLEFANIVILQNGIQKGGATSDMKGNFVIKPVPPGTYDMHATYVGYKDKLIKNVVVYSGKVTFQDLPMAAGIELEEVEVVEYSKPLIEQDNNTTGGALTAKEIRKAPTRSVNTLVGLAAGVQSDGGTPVIKGQRSNGTIYYVDGVKVRGLLGVPQNAIEQLTVITGGVPAQYGDALGGIISIVTKGPSERFYGSLEAISSQVTDPYGYNTVEGNISGPILKRYAGTDSEMTSLGFFVAGTYTYLKDNDPSAIGIWKIKDDVLADLEADPVRPNPNGGGFVSAANFVRKEDMEHVKTRPNTNQLSYQISPKIEWQPIRGFNVVLGGQVGFRNIPNDFYSYSLFNYKNYPRTIYNTYRGYARISQRFMGAEEGGLLRNVYYSIQADYNKLYNYRQRPKLGTNFFTYGHYGKFERYEAPFYVQGQDSVDGQLKNAWLLIGYIDTLVTFTPSDYNPVAANYTKGFFARKEKLGEKVFNLQQIRAEGGLVNGEAPSLVYSLWRDVGTPYSWYVKYEEDQVRVTASASADVGMHAVSFGVEYEQQTQRSYALNAASLWPLMEQLMNRHITELDKNQRQPVYDENGVFLDTVNYPRLIGPNQTTFDKNFRAFLKNNGYTDVYGRPITDRSFVNVHRYDPSVYQLDFFSADELLQNSRVFYYGFDYLGRKLTQTPSLNDFLQDSTRRLIAPFNPIYMAGYIQDKIVLKEKGLIFRLGLRVDRFDANQPVLKDPYVLYPTYTAGEVTQINGQPVQHPASVGSDYVVYVDKPKNPTRILGYRKGDEWYDANGTRLADPGVLAAQTATGKIAPYLKNPDKEEVTAESFKDYEPQVNIQPRIAFSFPISEDATFFANYDVLTQRPRDGVHATIDEFYYLRERPIGTVNNPALKPERRINYEIGFKQRLSKNSALTLTAYYGEVRDMVQITRVNYAYPVSYTTYGNLDFATVKGMTFTYDLRRTMALPVQAQLSYTLQFAEGTGSNANTAARLIDLGQPNLRVPFPLDFDRRHVINLMLDYRYGLGPAYTGPVTKSGRKILEGTGVNFIVSAKSGTPYSKQLNVTQAVALGVRQDPVLKGSVNGARKPWQFNVDMRVDRDIPLVFGKKKEGAARRPAGLNLYVWVQNLLNTKNIISVYRYTGRPDDDGWLASQEGMRRAQTQYDPQAYIDQYSIKVNNPDNYSNPRLVRLGLIFNF